MRLYWDGENLCSPHGEPVEGVVSTYETVSTLDAHGRTVNLVRVSILARGTDEMLEHGVGDTLDLINRIGQETAE
jgi:hypothetical protein